MPCSLYRTEVWHANPHSSPLPGAPSPTRYVEQLEAELRDTELKTDEAKKVVDALHAPHTETFQVRTLNPP